MKRFLFRFLLATAGTWVAATLIPGINSDGAWQTYALMGLFVAIGEMVLFIIQGGAALILFFIPRPVRIYGLRIIIVAIAIGLTSGFGLTPPITSQLIGLAGTTLIFSILFLLPFSS
ncbi:MAG: hypothetical protein Q7S57_03810 [bacterium]|nr:hypothetical protein [bacterium]